MYICSVCDFLYVDFNNYLHLHSRFAQNERQFLSNVQATACKVVLLNRSKESTMITLDGPASISKILLQLERRHRIMQQGQGNSLKNLLAIPSAFLTLGTLFMRKVEESITRSIKTILKHEHQHQRLLNQRSITLSGPCTLGEAEDKIMTSLQKRWESLTSSTGKMEKRFAIFGCDGDLLVYTIATSPLFVDFINCIPSSSGIKNSLSKFSKDLWVDELRQLFPNIKSIERIMDDFLFLTLMCGNDYLPSVAYGGIKSTWHFYVAFQSSQQYPKFIVQLDRLNSTLDVDNFKEFLEFLFTNNSALQNQRMYSKTLLQFNRIQPDEYLRQLLEALHNLQTKTFNGHFHEEGWQEKGGPTIFELYDLLLSTNQNIQTKEINKQNNLLVQSPSISAIMVSRLFGYSFLVAIN